MNATRPGCVEARLGRDGVLLYDCSEAGDNPIRVRGEGWEWKLRATLRNPAGSVKRCVGEPNQRSVIPTATGTQRMAL